MQTDSLKSYKKFKLTVQLQLTLILQRSLMECILLVGFFYSLQATSRPEIIRSIKIMNVGIKYLLRKRKKLLMARAKRRCVKI
jgi:hypothetical protein